MGAFVVAVAVIVAAAVILGVGGWIARACWRKWHASSEPLQTSFPFDLVTSADALAELMLDRAEEWAIEYRHRELPGEGRTIAEVLDKERFTLIRGRTGSGKTREVLELVRRMERGATDGIAVLIPHRSPAFPPFEWPRNLKTDHVLLLLEDLHNRRFVKAGEPNSSDDYARWLPTAIKELRDRVGAAGEFRVIGTIREDVFPKGNAADWREHIGRRTSPIWRDVAEIQVPQLSAEDSTGLSASAATLYGVTLTERQAKAIGARTDGRPASVVGPFRAMERGHRLTDDEVQRWTRTVEERVALDWDGSIRGHPQREALFAALDLLAQAGATPRRNSIVELAARLVSGGPGRRWPPLWVVRLRVAMEIRRVEAWIQERPDGTLNCPEPYYLGRARLDEHGATVVGALRSRYERGDRRLAPDHVNLGNALLSLPVGDRRENVELAIECYELIFGVYTREAFPASWATTQNNLGIAYGNRIAGERADNIERAIGHFEQALEVLTREAFPADWAMTQNNLGAAYGERISGERADNIERAIGHYERALEVHTREAFPTDWAATRNNLGNAYGERIAGERAGNIERAIGHYEQALEVYTREAFPADWALTQNNLGTAYGKRIAGEQADNIERAIGHFEQALEVHAREAFPANWAATRNNLGNAYGERIAGERAGNIERAIGHYEQALEVRTREAFPADWAATKYNLGNAYGERIAGERADNIERAIGHYEQALEVYTRDAWPERYEIVKHALESVARKRDEDQTDASHA